MKEVDSVTIFKIKLKTVYLKLLLINSKNRRTPKAIMKDVSHCTAVFVAYSRLLDSIMHLS